MNISGIGSTRDGIPRSARSLIMLSLLCLFSGNFAHGADCPDEQTAAKGFVLERPDVRTEIHQSADQVAIANNVYASAPPQKQFLVGGLIEVFRTSSKGQFVAMPTSDFRDVFPLAEGEEQEIDWLWLNAKNNKVEANTLSLKVTGRETLDLGKCRYDVLAVRQVLMGGQGEVMDVWTSLYSPVLRAVLAKRYDEGTAKENTVAFKTIKPLVE